MADDQVGGEAFLVAQFHQSPGHRLASCGAMGKIIGQVEGGRNLRRVERVARGGDEFGPGIGRIRQRMQLMLPPPLQFQREVDELAGEILVQEENAHGQTLADARGGWEGAGG